MFNVRRSLGASLRDCPAAPNSHPRVFPYPMPEVAVASLDPRHQKLIENSRVALDRGNLDYVLEVTALVLGKQPGCLPVRRLQRVAQLRAARGKGGGFM